MNRCNDVTNDPTIDIECNCVMMSVESKTGVQLPMLGNLFLISKNKTNGRFLHVHGV